ncbi:MAG TPA: SpoIIE family protein phosphatase [Clostridiales bacterium]|nr:SpoIIE family protein phosphatase [Clostridiales bacterium]
MMKEILSNKIIVATIIISLVIVTALIIFLVFNRAFRIRRKPKRKALARRLKATIGNAQTIGTREKQDDSFATDIMDYGILAVVADGIGGYINGNIASSIAVETYLDEFQKCDVTGNIRHFFNKSAVLSNERIRDEFGEAKGGTTLVAVVIENNQMHWTSVGDSNIAVFRDGRLISVNRKENYKNWLEDQYYAGAISKEDAMDDRQGKHLVNYIGYDGFKMTDETEYPVLLQKNDKIIVYSDGVELLSQIELEKILSKRATAQKIAETIIDATKQKQARNKDNATVIVISLK